MRKINYMLMLFLLCIGANHAKADDYTLALGNYDEIGEGDYNEDQTYDGSWWMVAPTQYNVKHTGSQIIYTKDQLKDMAGKEITSISFKYFNLSAYQAYPRTINVWVKEIDDNAFAYNDTKKAYCYFEYSDATKAATDITFAEDFVDYSYMSRDLKVDFDKPFAYSGTKNLLVTITFDGDEYADTPSDIEFYYNTDDTAKKKAMAACSDNSTFEEFNESEDWPYAKKGAGSTISHADELEQPLTKFTYQDAQVLGITSITLSESGLGTFCNSKTVKMPEGLTAYTATVDNNAVTLTKVEDGIIPAGNGVVLSGEASKSYDIEVTTSDKTKLGSNELVGTIERTLIENDYSFVLVYDKNQAKSYFKNFKNGAYLPAGKAYLPIPTATQDAKFHIVIDATSGINAIENGSKADKAYYTLDGQKAIAPQKGVYIHCGKKVVIK